MANLIEWLDNIQTSTQNIMVTAEDEKSYTPFIINRGMAQGIDTIMLAQEANKAHHMPVSAQYSFYRHAVSKKKRYNKWAKKEVVEEHVELVSRAYQVSLEKAAEMVELLDESQLAVIKQQLDTGGVKGRGSKAAKGA